MAKPTKPLSSAEKRLFLFAILFILAFPAILFLIVIPLTSR